MPSPFSDELRAMLREDLAVIDPAPPGSRLAGLSARAALSAEQQASFRAAYDGTAAAIVRLAQEYCVPRNQIVTWARELGIRNPVQPHGTHASDPAPSYRETMGLDDDTDLAGLPVVRRLSGPDRGWRGLVMPSDDDERAEKKRRRREMHAEAVSEAEWTEAAPAGKAKWCMSCNRLHPAGMVCPKGDAAPAAAVSVPAPVSGPVKRCRKCQRERPRTSAYFRPWAPNADGFADVCRECSGSKPAATPGAKRVSVAPATLAALPGGVDASVALPGGVQVVQMLRSPTTRLPVVLAPVTQSPVPPVPVAATPEPAEPADATGPYFATMRGLLDELPRDTGHWTERERTRWLAAFVGLLDYLIEATPAEESTAESDSAESA